MELITIEADSKKEAIHMAFKKYGISVMKDCSKSWRRDGKPIERKDLLMWGVEQLDRLKLTNHQGVGIIIIESNPVMDRYVRSWTFERIAEGRPRRLKEPCYNLHKASDDSIIATVDTQRKAENLCKTLMKTVQDDVYCKLVYNAANPIRFIMRYKPNKYMKKGVYKIIGISNYIQHDFKMDGKKGKL